MGKELNDLESFLNRGTDLGLMELRPVWLMNPDVASRILPLKAGLFDTVIYDEASQIPVEFALPTLYRAKISIVSGDEKQMPIGILARSFDVPLDPTAPGPRRLTTTRHCEVLGRL